MATTLDKLDDLAASLVSAYAREGKFCVITRAMDSADSDVRVIAVQTDVTKLSEFLRIAADVLFEGPATVVHKLRRIARDS